MSGSAHQIGPGQPVDASPVTLPNGFTADRAPVNYGKAGLSVGLFRDGTIVFKLGGAGFVDSDGVGLGLVGAVIASHVLGSLLYGVKPRDPLTLAGDTIVLVTVALTAAFIPARRGARMDPILALRTE